METEIIPAPRTNGHDDGYRRLDALERRVGELGEQLRAAHDRIEELEEKLTGEGLAKLLDKAQRAQLDKELRDNPAAREQAISIVMELQKLNQAQKPG